MNRVDPDFNGTRGRAGIRGRPDSLPKLFLDRARSGDIFCLHDGKQTEPSPDIRVTLEAVEAMIPALKERGLRFETVSQILCPIS